MRSKRQPVAPKVPEITALFRVIKIVTTGMGESTSDYLGNVSIALAAGVGFLGLAFALWLQFRVTRYVAPVYWLAVVMVVIVGTGAADVLHGQAHIPYIGSTAFYAVIVAAVFYLWHRGEGTLSIHSIVTRRRETYYWITVFATFARGTAAGDMTASTMHLGFLSSGSCSASSSWCRRSVGGASSWMRRWRSGSPTCSPARRARHSPTG
jgi:uncharacterized membrane-anchored protein